MQSSLDQYLTVEYLDKKLNQTESLEILIKACILAQSKGVYKLEESELIAKAIRAFVKKPSEQ